MLYHLDVGHRLTEGLTIELDGKRPSLFGLSYISKFRQFGVTDSLHQGDLTIPVEHLDPTTFREYALEFFRVHHPLAKDLKLPSRLCSFFATRSAEDAKRYAKRNGYKKEIRVFEVHAQEEPQGFDMTWLDREFPKKIDESTSYYLRGYWEAIPLTKILI